MRPVNRRSTRVAVLIASLGCLVAGAAPARPAAAAAFTGSAADRAIVWVRTSGVLTHVETASLARGASQMTASVAMKVSMEMVAARATRLWG